VWEVPVADIQSDKAHAAARDTAGTRLSAKRAAKAAKKAAQRGTSNPVEEVAKSVREVNAWIDVHGRKIWFALAAVVLVCVGWFAVSSYQDKRDREAGELLRAAIATSHGIIVSADEPAPEEPLYPTFNSVQERDDKALQQFRALLKKFPNSQAARYAILGEANALLELAKFSEAAAAYARALEAPHASEDTFLRVRALEGSGYALEGQKQYPQARKRFEELSRLQNGAYRTLGDYHRARMLVAEGQRAEARKLLEALSKAAADKPEEQGERFESVAQAAQNLLSELGGQPADKAGGKNSGISQSVLDALRKQLATQKK
jgi:tetratricopeptide (TPR) repeat protein